MEYPNTKALILAAGKGTRFSEDGGPPVPKVLKTALGRPLLEHVLSALSFLSEEDIAVVVGFSKEMVCDFLRQRGRYLTAVQEQQRGTGDAVRAAAALLSNFDGNLLVTAGDMPLVTEDTYRALIDRHLSEKNACTILSADADDPTGYGRVIRGDEGRFRAIREHADCSSDELSIREVATSVYVFNSVLLFHALESITPENAQGEYYLTDVPHILLSERHPIGVHKAVDAKETMGVNTPEQLKEVERVLISRQT